MKIIVIGAVAAGTSAAAKARRNSEDARIIIYEKDTYGYEISNEIVTRTNNQFEIKEATLYAVFQRLVKKE